MTRLKKWLHQKTTKKQSYASEIHNRLSNINHLLITFFDPQFKNMGYIVSTTDDINVLVTLVQDPTTPLLTRFLSYRSHPITYEENFHGMKTTLKVLFLWNEETQSYATHRLYRPANIHDHINELTLVYEIANISENPLYLAMQQIQSLMDYTTRAKDNTDAQQFIQHLSQNQNVVDYIIKLDAIGNDPSVFGALLRRGSEWQAEFFKPLFSITNQLATLSNTNEQSALERADQNLDTIANWSSSTLFPIDLSTMKP